MKPGNSNRTATAKVLELGRTTLARKLKEYRIADEGWY
jgi:DNA-binding NtrC family response regulator